MKKRTRLTHHTHLALDKSGSIHFPLHTATVFRMSEPSSHDGFQYGRVGNPTRKVLDEKLAEYASARYAISVSSGSAALATLFFELSVGDEVVVHDCVYEGTLRILSHLKRFHIKSHLVDCSDMHLLQVTLTKLKKVKILLIETPTNPTLQVLDIAKLGKIARSHNVVFVVDNTMATSMVQNPLSLGADIIVESLSKSVNGHSDVIGGMIATNELSTFTKIQNQVFTFGPTFSPRDSHEVLRGMRTLELRLSRQNSTAAKVKSFLDRHKGISRVLFPSSKYVTIAQMKNRGFLISFNVTIDPAHFLRKLQLITIAHSFGGTETVIQQPATMMDLSLQMPILKKYKIDHSFFRLSIGLEDPEQIIADLRQALKSN